MKTFQLLVIIGLSTLLPVIARADNAMFVELIKSGNGMEKTSQPVARNIYNAALKKAQTDDERAQAQLGIARNTPMRMQDDAPDKVGIAKNAEFLKVLALSQAPATTKADALLGMAQVQTEINRFESALKLLVQVRGMADALAAQKLRAQYWRGQILAELKQFDAALAALSDYLMTASLDVAGKIEVWQHLARVHLGKGEAAKAKGVLALTINFPVFNDDTIADVHIANGQFLNAKGYPAAAREEYSQVAILANAAAAKNVLARYEIGATYFSEKDYALARETWTLILEMRGAEQSGGDLWKAIGLAHVGEKNYAAAREDYEKWLAVPQLTMRNRAEAYQNISETYIQEKNYPAARATLEKILQETPSSHAIHMQSQFNIADIYRTEGDFENTAKVYLSMLETIASHYKIARNKTPGQYNAENTIEVATATLAKTPASMAAAYTLYEAMEKHYAYDKEKAEANLGMGDILLTQGKRDEAKAKYLKALELRKNYDEGKLADKKLKQLG